MLSRRLQRTNKGQYLLTVPKQIVDLLGLLDKQEILFGFEKGKIVLVPKRVDVEGRSKKRGVPRA